MNFPLKSIQLSNMEIVLRKDFYSKFDNFFKELASNMGLYFFHHNLIQNYREPGHKVSSFGNNEEWSEIYWTKHCNDDPVEKACNLATQKTGFAISSWQVIDPTSACMEARTTICDVKDGLSMAFNHNGLIEHISFGWKKFNFENFSFQKIAELSQLIDPVRQHHLSTFNNENPNYKVEV